MCLTLKISKGLRVQLLKHTQHEVLCSLCMLPKTQHDLSSFVVDTWLHMETMLCFSVNGVFKEVEGTSQDSNPGQSESKAQGQPFAIFSLLITRVMAWAPETWIPTQSDVSLPF
ncbi:Nuclear Rna Export Factor 3 [Manis pentadactyla]|nr:Nuclear Rna Export Factor 3 [Manis pentadactyla]